MSLSAAVATTKLSDAEKAAKSKEKTDAAAAKEKAKADKQAANAASLTHDGQVRNLKNLIQQHIDKAARLVCDYHQLKPNMAKRQLVVKLIQDAGVNLW